jgi:hypothetical protein
MVVLLPSPTSACSVSLSVSLSGSVGSTYDLLQVYTSVHIRHWAGADRHHPKLDWHGWAFTVPSLVSSQTCAFETRLDSPRPTLPLPPPPMFRCLHAPLPSRTVLSTLSGSEASRRKPSASHTAGVASEPQKYALQWWDWSRFGGQVWVRCFNVRRLAFEGRRSWGRTRSSPFFPCVLSPACFPPPPPPFTSPPPTTWLPLSSEEGEPGACSAVFRFVRSPAAWQACALWGADLEASLPCCRCRLRFDAVWPSTVEVLPIR